MIAPAIPDNEERRLQALRRLALLDSQAEERFDRITRIASGLFDVPITFVSLIDENRQWIKSCFGVDVQETSRDSSFCGHTILSGELLVIPDALLDPRFCDNPFVVGPPHIRFYAGCPLAVEDDLRVGTLCLLDTQPRNLEKEELNLLRNLAEIAREEMIKSERSGAPSEKEECLNFLLTSSDTGFFDGRPGSAICHLSPRLKAILGYDDDEPAHNYETLRKLIHHDDKMALPAIEPTNPGLTSFSREFRMLHKAGGWV